jgi:hypothetical protein
MKPCGLTCALVYVQIVRVRSSAPNNVHYRHRSALYVRELSALQCVQKNGVYGAYIQGK